MNRVSFYDMWKRGVKKCIPELKELDDADFSFDVEMVEAQCPRCGGPDHIWRYRLHNESNWRTYRATEQCRECDDSDVVKKFLETREQKIKEELIERYWFIPTDLENAGFKTYQQTNSITTKALNEAVAYVRDFKNSKPEDRFNLLMMGNPGTGKTHLSVAIAKNLRESGFVVGFVTTGKLLAMIKETYQQGAERSENNILKDISKFDLLVLDDLGAEGASDNQWAQGRLFDIINNRLGKPTVYTTNFNDLTISQAVGERIASRLYVNTKFIDLYTDDYRKRLRVV
jgi:DNA replication protein DnaC